MSQPSRDIAEQAERRDWPSLTAHPPRAVAEALSFEDTLRTARALLYDDAWDDGWQRYAVDLLQALRDVDPAAWARDWRHDAFLGQAADVALRYATRFEAYARALRTAEPPPPELELQVARCHFTPGEPPVSRQRAIELLSSAVEARRLAPAAEMLARLLEAEGDTAAADTWRARAGAWRDDGDDARSLDPPPWGEQP